MSYPRSSTSDAETGRLSFLSVALLKVHPMAAAGRKGVYLAVFRAVGINVIGRETPAMGLAWTCKIDSTEAIEPSL